MNVQKNKIERRKKETRNPMLDVENLDLQLKWGPQKLIWSRI